MTELSISGMTCASCASHVGKALRKVPGVQDAAVNLATERASVSHEASVAAAQLIAAVERAGYGARLVERGANETAEQADALRRRQRALILAIALFVPTLVLGMAVPAFPAKDALMLVLCAPVWAIAGAPFHRGALAAARHGTANMDTLVSLGSSVAFFYSIYATFAGLPSYYETASAIVTLIAAGKYLEAAAKSRSGAAISALAAMRPRVAHVRRGTETFSIPIEDVRAGDMLVVSAGERVPADGTIVDGSSSVDVSMLTGEPMPVPVSPGTTVHEGTINGEGTLVVRAQAVGEGTTLARIIEIVRRAQGSMPPVQRVADRAAAVFVPAILVIAALTFVAWIATSHSWPVAMRVAVAVLIVACPCALGLATPLAVIAGVGAAAKRGILFRDATAAERLAGVQSVIFDKTGTLTEGKPRVVHIAANEMREDEVVALAASLESGSRHPLARAIQDFAIARNIAVTPASNIRTAPGAGISGEIGGRTYFVGNRAYVTAHGATNFPAHGDATSVFVCDGARVLGCISLADEMREHAADAVRALESRGLEISLLSGDAPGSVTQLAKRAGIEHWRAQQTPEQKAAYVNDQRARLRVAFVGDGINDAPALASADVGIAMGGGTEVALEAAQAALLGDDPLGVVRAIDVARATMRTIKQNLFWAFCYNAVLVPLAAAGRVHPIAAAAAMGASSLFVSANSFLLLRRRFTSDG